MIPVRRNLESVSEQENRVLLVGWIFPLDDSDPRGVEIAVFPTGTARVCAFRTNESADVASANPGHEAAKACRFQLLLEVAGTPPDGYVLQLRPRFTAGTGRSWHIGVRLKSAPEEFVERVGGGAGVGLEFIDYFVDYADLGREESVLDFGCGTGRMALPMARMLNSSSKYLGIDLDAELIDWCNRNIGSSDSRFHFMRSNSMNMLYNPSGEEIFQIHAPTDSVTFAFATSVFTHLCASQAREYLAELARCTKKGGRVLVTAYLFESAPPVGASLRFQPLDRETWTTNMAVPETVTGFQLDSFVEWTATAGFKLRHLLPGSWAKKIDEHSFQDVLVLDR
jgi:SAM-dependent methyltransferase